MVTGWVSPQGGYPPSRRTRGDREETDTLTRQFKVESDTQNQSHGNKQRFKLKYHEVPTIEEQPYLTTDVEESLDA